MAVGLDCGTAFLVSARRKEDAGVKHVKLRNSFYCVDDSSFIREMLDSIKVSYISKDNVLYVIGESGLELAASFNSEARRPMSQGMLSPKEKEALPIIKLMFEELLGKPKKEGEVCCFSVPGIPVDAPKDIVYHEGMVKSLVESLGYQAISINEPLAIVFSELLDTKLCGIGLSFGAGMINCVIANYSIPVSSFSISKSGDWIDIMAAQSQGMSVSKMTQLKENELDLSKEQDSPALKALSLYYDSLIDHCIKNIAIKFNQDGKMIEEKEGGVPIVVAGGTSMVPGFIDKFNKKLEENKSRFSFNIKEVRHAKQPLFAVSSGCLIAALKKDKN